MTGRPGLPPLGTLLVIATAGTALWWAATQQDDPPISAAGLERDARSDARQEDTATARVANTGTPALDPKILERPLFADTRRPAKAKVVVPPPPEPEIEPEPEPVEVVAPKAPPKPPEVAFRGTMQGGAGRLALIAEGQQSGRWLARGAKIGVWELSEIGQHHVVFRHGSYTHRIELYR